MTKELLEKNLKMLEALKKVVALDPHFDNLVEIACDCGDITKAERNLLKKELGLE